MGARAVRRARERDDVSARRTRAKERLPSVRARSNAGDSSRGRRRECVVYWDLDNATPGKQQALIQVNEFLVWLETAAEDEED